LIFIENDLALADTVNVRNFFAKNNVLAAYVNVSLTTNKTYNSKAINNEQIIFALLISNNPKVSIYVEDNVNTTIVNSIINGKLFLSPGTGACTDANNTVGEFIGSCSI
jgi:hypothetical protein